MSTYTTQTYISNDYNQIVKWDNIINKSGLINELLDELYYEGDDRHGDGFTSYLTYIITKHNKRDRDYN